MSQPTSLVETELVSRTRPVDDPGDLLDRLGPGGFAWLRGGRGLVAVGVAARVLVGAGPDRFDTAARRVAEVLDAVEVEDAVDLPATGPIAVGALPFASDRPGALVVPRLVLGQAADGTAWVTENEPAGADPLPPARRGPGNTGPSRFTVDGHAHHDRWVAAVERARAAIEEGRVHKVVVAREATVEADRPLDLPGTLRRLRESHPACFTFAAGGLVGASPELLVSKQGPAVASEPVAGTGAPGAFEATRSSVKEQDEHRLVVDAVVDALAPVCEELAVPDEFRALELTNVVHLATRVSGRLRDPDRTVLELVGRLHPTPAVAGTPTDEALRVIAELEGLDRGRYAGPVGWVDRRGDGEWAVALRCAEVDGTRARLFAGAGIVAGSDAESEWVETQRKLEAMLVALIRP